MAENYRIVTGGLGGTNMTTLPTTLNEEELYKDNHFNFFLTTITDGLYRLHSRNSKSIRDYHSIRCTALSVGALCRNLHLP